MKNEMQKWCLSVGLALITASAALAEEPLSYDQKIREYVDNANWGR